MEKDLPTLRKIINSKDWCKLRFEEAEKLSHGIFEGNRNKVALPYFTDHGIEHCKNVETHLDKILFGGPASGEKDFIPSAEEAMYLLSAAYLHDIGMIYGIFDGENPSNLANNQEKIKSLRDDHERRTSEYILENWKLNCGWSPEEKTLLANLCHFHRIRHSISSFTPRETRSKHDQSTTRLIVLASLLRLADGCHVDQSRAPGFLRGFYDSIGMSPEAVQHWESSEMISYVSFDHEKRRIELVGLSIPVFDFPLGKFDLRELVERTRQDVENEMRSVQPILMGYPNTAFTQIDCTIYPIDALAVKTPQQCLAVWPYLLHRPSSATEICAALVQLLLFATKDRKDFGQAWRNRIDAIMSEALRSRPFDFMVKNLCYQVKKIMSEESTGEEFGYKLLKYFHDYLETSIRTCNVLAINMSKLVESHDAIIVYGYSTNVAKFLENIRRTHSGPVYIVECHIPAQKVKVGVNETDRIKELAVSLGLEVYYVELFSLAQVIDNFKQRGINCKVVLGTHGVLKNGDLVCKIGTRVLTILAKEFGAKILAFADSKKFLSNGEKDTEVVSSEKLLDWSSTDQQTFLTNLHCVRTRIDIISASIVDSLVTEEGVKKGAATPSPKVPEKKRF